MSIKRRSRNGAFIIELLTVIAIFAVCAAACVRVIGIAASEMKYAERLSDAQIKTADIAECYKSGESISALSQRYADSDIVRESIKTTKLHKLVVIYRGAEMVACEEAEE